LDSNPEFRESIITTISAETFPVKMFVWLCDRHLILPVMYIKFRNHNVLSFLSHELSSHLEYVYELNKKRNLEIIQQVDQINTILKLENISPVYLKGTGNLLDQLYSDPGERMIGDIDLLVVESDYLRVIDAIISLGYKYEKEGFLILSTQKHFYRLYKHDVPADIEIHRFPVSISYSKKYSREMVFADRILAQGNSDSFVPSIEHRIIHNFIHAQLSNKGHWQKSNSLRDLYDLYLLSNQASLVSLVNKVEERNKFISYIVFADRVFNLNNSLYPLKNRRANFYCYSSDFFLNHGRFYKINQFIYKFYDLIIYLLPNRIRFASKNKLYRKHILDKIKSEGIFSLVEKL
jgi:hypothetical protein